MKIILIFSFLKSDHFDSKLKQKYQDHKPLLVPIRIEIESGAQKLKDYFLWDKNDPAVTPEMFAAIECNDFRVINCYFLINL